MRAMMITAPGVPGEMALSEQPSPVPGAGEVLIDTAYAGLNFADTMLRRGTYPHPVSYPILPGFEVSGRIKAVGPGVTEFAVGERIAAYVEHGGGYAQETLVPVAAAIRLPDTLDFKTGASFPLQAMTGWHMLHTVGRLEKGQSVLIHAIGGGVGLWTTQIAVHAGARVIGTVGSKGKETRPLEFGASRVINRTNGDFVAAALEMTEGAGVDLLIDSLGADTLDRSFDAVRKLGHVISIGEAEGMPYPNIRERILPRSQTFTRFHLGHVEPGSKAFLAARDDLLDGLTSGWLKPPIAEIFPFEEALAMHLALESRGMPGKLLLEIGGETV